MPISFLLIMVKMAKPTAHSTYALSCFDIISFSIMKCERKTDTQTQNLDDDNVPKSPMPHLNRKYCRGGELACNHSLPFAMRLFLAWEYDLTLSFIARSMSEWTRHINNLPFNLNVNYAVNATGSTLASPLQTHRHNIRSVVGLLLRTKVKSR